MIGKYRNATREELEEYDCDPTYDLLVGPGGFECLLTEPEDRNWWRDGMDVVNELNRLHKENQRLLMLFHGQVNVTQMAVT